MSDTPRNVYTVMAGCGVGEFLWHKSASDPCLVGANVFSQMDRAEDQDLISEGLFKKLWDWADQFMAAQPPIWGEPWQIDWLTFNARGMELARMLKAELGASAEIQYVRAHEDPHPDSLLLQL